MQPDRARRLLDVATAVLLGLVSVVTALGAWQAAAWDAAASEFERDAGDARDVSVNQSVLADAAGRADLVAGLDARALALEAEGLTDPLEALAQESRIAAAVAATTPGYSDRWTAWRESGFAAAADPATDPEYLVARDGTWQSYAAVGDVLDRASTRFDDRSGVLAQAALVQALALFLLGIAGVNRGLAVRTAVVVLAAVVFLTGTVIAVSSFGVG